MMKATQLVTVGVRAEGSIVNLTLNPKPQTLNPKPLNPKPLNP